MAEGRTTSRKDQPSSRSMFQLQVRAGEERDAGSVEGPGKPQACASADLEKAVERVEAVGVEKDPTTLSQAEPRGLDVDMRQQVIIQWLFIVRRQARRW
jgi:hypothetical protein